MKKILLTLAVCFASITMGAQNLIVMSKEGRVFDQPNNKSYPTTNRNGENVILSPGMVFPSSNKENGWVMIQYTPGLQGYIFSQLTAGSDLLGKPVGGKYITANSNKPVEIYNSGNQWKINVSNNTFDGEESENIVIFKNEFSNIVYSLVVLNGKPLVMDYNNEITKFF